jgi:glycine/D-amino acid oxidase-like deaminating enzyme
MTAAPDTAAIGEPQIARTATDEWAWRPGHSVLPASVEVAIIGGGIVGCSAALVLAQRGVSVALFEKGRIAGEQSGRNWGWVRQQGRSAIEVPLMMRSLQLWRQWAQSLGEDLGFHQGGSLYLAESPAALEELGDWLPVAREHGLDTTLLDAQALARVLSSNAQPWRGALYTASDGRAEPGRAAPGIARAAVRAGARVYSQCAVRGLERAGGRVSAVVTEHGVVSATTVVCAAGAWTRLFCASMDVAVPQLKVLGTVARTAPAAKILDGEAWCPEVAIRRRADGGYTVAHGSTFRHDLTPSSVALLPKFLPVLRGGSDSIRVSLGREFWEALRTPRRWPLDRPSPFERQRVLDPAPEQRVLAAMSAALRRRFPELAVAPFVETWGGMIETSPDVLPILAPMTAPAGLFVATGFSGHGFGIGPGAGEFIADAVTGGLTAAALAPFRLSRFYDGSPIVPGPSI